MGQNIISINGKNYDAKTGKIVADNVKSPTVTKKSNPKTGVSIDGFSKKRSTSSASTPAANVHSRNEKSKTLMRGVVKKPVTGTIRTNPSLPAKNTAPVSNMAPTFQSVIPPNKDMALRASKITKSKFIGKFGAPKMPTSQKTTVAQIPVAKPPLTSAPKQQSYHKPKPVNNFESAINNANSHQYKMLKKPTKRQKIAKKLRLTPRALSFGSFVLAGLLLGGFFVYQNIPTMAMKVASTRSGVSATLPKYHPSGFGMSGPIKYSAGQISVNYKSNTDDRNYKVTQSNSDWNSEALLDNFVTAERRTYQTYEDKGRTIYIYDNSNATWVDGGVWYQIEGASSLTSDQLLRIANSI